MHDAKGRELKIGDIVMVPFVVDQVYASPEYCNLQLTSLATMPGNNSKTCLGAINTKQVLRANEGDDLSFDVVTEDGASRLV